MSENPLTNAVKLGNKVFVSRAEKLAAEASGGHGFAAQVKVQNPKDLPMPGDMGYTGVPSDDAPALPMPGEENHSERNAVGIIVAALVIALLIRDRFKNPHSYSAKAKRAAQEADPYYMKREEQRFFDANRQENDRRNRGE